MTGYGYGLWLVIDNKHIKTKHIPHVTLICNMERSHVMGLYDRISEYFRYMIPKVYMNIERKSVLFDTDMYSDTDDNILTKQAWGYNCNTDDYNLLMIQQLIREFMIEYQVKGSIPPKLHLTMEYGKELSDIMNNMKNYDPQQNDTLMCKIKVVDITSDNPSEWLIIK